MPVTALDVHGATWPLLDAIAGVTAYDGEVVDDDGRPANPPLDDDGRVASYAVLHAGAGRLLSLTLDGAQDSLETTFQVTCVGGDRVRALWCAGKVRTAFVGTVVTIDGREHVIRASDIEASPRVEDNVKPPRHSLPVLFSLFVP